MVTPVVGMLAIVMVCDALPSIRFKDAGVDLGIVSAKSRSWSAADAPSRWLREPEGARILPLRGGFEEPHPAGNKTKRLHGDKVLSISRPSIIKAFQALDLDGSGYISRSELQNALHAVRINATESEASRIFDSLDQNLDGSINFEEFERGVARAIASRSSWLGDEITYDNGLMEFFGLVRTPLATEEGTTLQAARHFEQSLPAPLAWAWSLPRRIVKWVHDAVEQTDRQKEDSRRFRRTIFSEKDWVNFRSSWRFVDNLATLHTSTAVRSLWPQIACVSAAAAAVLVSNAALFAAAAALAGRASVEAPAKAPWGWGGGPVSLPLTPFTLASPALCLLLVFRTNAAFTRWADARAAVGAVVRQARDFVRQAVTWMPESEREEIVRRVVALARVIKRKLRGDSMAEEEIVKHQLKELLGKAETARLLAADNRPQAALADISFLIRQAHLDPLISNRLENILSGLSGSLGTCERISKTPAPLVYTRHTSRFLLVWMLLLPLALYRDMRGSPVIIPVSAVLSTFLFGIEELGVQIEEPFSILPIENACDSLQTSVVELYGRSLAAVDHPPAAGPDAKRLWQGHPATVGGPGHRLGTLRQQIHESESAAAPPPADGARPVTAA